ncbi:MAG: ATP-dependent helicase [Candidatus Omnitrophica bacterium]|nr:ATP-dependent helicase [Candidatus Omnitrophota bacterium]
MTLLQPSLKTKIDEPLLEQLTAAQREAVTHPQGPLLILAGAGTGKTTVIARRIAWLLSTQRAAPNDILALTFTEKAAAEMEERVDLLVPYGCVDMAISTFHAFGDRLIRDNAVLLGLSLHARVLSKPEQVVFAKQRLYDLPLERFRPSHDPTRYLDALVTAIARAKDEAVTPEEFVTYARLHPEARELGECYAAYQQLLHQADGIDFGDQVLLAVQLFERHPEVAARYQQQFRYILVDEFQDTNFAQFRLMQLLAPPTSNVTVVGDDDQAIYKWRGASISNVVKFLEHYRDVRRIVLTENFRSSQPILDSAYRLIRHNDPHRLEATEQIDKRLIAMSGVEGREPKEPQLAVFDTTSSEADWVVRQIQAQVEAGKRQPGDFAILVRTNRDADGFLRALNVCDVPWHFSGATGFSLHPEAKVLVSCLKALADPDDTLSWYHVLSSSLYAPPMQDVMACLAWANRNHQSLRQALEEPPPTLEVSPEGRQAIDAFLNDAHRLVELSRTRSPGQLLYRWLSDTGWLKRQAALEEPRQIDALQMAAKLFDQLRRFEESGITRLPELMQSFDLFQTFSEAGEDETDLISRDRVNVLTIHKAKGLEFPVVFMVGLLQGRFPTPLRRDPIELPEPLIKDLLPSGDYHLQEERRLFYVAMTRAKEELTLTASYRHGGKSTRRLSQFVREALNVTSDRPAPEPPSTLERIARVGVVEAPRTAHPPTPLPEPLRLSPYGLDDYLTCPLKFRYSHVLRIPIMRHHLVIYGAALHKAVELFFKRRLEGREMGEDELLEVFRQAWSSEGFLSREHETQRLDEGLEVLRRFFHHQQQAPERPSLIEEKFSFSLDDFFVVGRWDRVDREGKDAVIIDYKSSDVDDQIKANQRVRESLQMAVYALAWKMIHGQIPKRLELRFLETDVIGQAVFSDEDLNATTDHLRQVARGIRGLDFRAEPDVFSCRWCAYQSICPSALA